ncbi:MAG TPA: VOC family protein [Fontimonas sp.]
MHPHARGPVRQIAWVVDDLEASIRRWIGLHGVGPWTVYRNATMAGRCRGQDTSVKMHVGLSYQGEVQIELIQVLSKTPSPYQDGHGRSLNGMHHIAWHSTQLDADVAAATSRGMRAVFEASNGAVRVAYLEADDDAGVLYEFIEAVPAVTDSFTAGQLAARQWDGVSAPVTVIDFEAR